MAEAANELALVLGGGGARAAYQVGFLRCLARHFPHLDIPILTGVSAGAINACFLANHRGTFAESVEDLADLWHSLTMDQVFCIDTWNLLKSMARWGCCLAGGGAGKAASVRGLVETSPLAALLRRRLAPAGGPLSGVAENLRRGKLQALAITGTDYGTGQAVTWVQGKSLPMWERPHRRSVSTAISVAHIMASAALPIFFPAIEIEASWYGDGGIRQTAPLAPALHLGARSILAISTRHERLPAEADPPPARGYPPLAQVIGTMMNSVFLDMLDQDARTLELVNRLLEPLPQSEMHGPVPVKLFLLRPSCDIGRLSGQFEPHLPGMFRYLSRGIGTHRTQSPDWLSMVMFEPRYLERLMNIGNEDAETRLKDIAALLERTGRSTCGD